MDEDPDSLSPDQLLAEVRRLRAAIRQHRGATGHALCWHQPQRRSLLPEPTPAAIAVPEWPQFLRGCVATRQSLDEQAGAAPRTREEYKGG